MIPLHVLIPPSAASPTAACFQFRLCVWLTTEREEQGWSGGGPVAMPRRGREEGRDGHAGVEGDGWGREAGVEPLPE